MLSDFILNLDSALNYVSATPSPDQVVGDTLFWNFSQYNLDSAHIVPSVLVSTPLTAQIGDTIHLETCIPDIAGDRDSTNNVVVLDAPVVNGYDPNDNQVYPLGECEAGYIPSDQELAIDHFGFELPEWTHHMIMWFLMWGGMVIIG